MPPPPLKELQTACSLALRIIALVLGLILAPAGTLILLKIDPLSSLGTVPAVGGLSLGAILLFLSAALKCVNREHIPSTSNKDARVHRATGNSSAKPDVNDTPLLQKSSYINQTINKFRQLQNVVTSQKSVEAMVAEIKELGLHGFVHLDNNEWTGKHPALIANIKACISLLSNLITTVGEEEAGTIVNGASTHCLHGVADAIQGHLLSRMKEDILLFVPCMDVRHTVEQRVGEFVRVYRNCKAKEILETQRHQADKQAIQQYLIRNDLKECMIAADIVAWCEKNEYIGSGTTSVRFSPNSTGILQKDQAVAAIIALLQVL